MDFLFLEQSVVDCMQLIPGMRFSNQQKPHVVTFFKVLKILNRYSGYSFIIRCTGEINAAGVIDMVKKHINPTIGLPFSIGSDQDVLFMSAEFPEWLIKHGIRHKVSTTYYPETDGQTERKNTDLTEMFAAHEL